MKINYLNHASVLMEIGDIKLLTDPWFLGTCFDDGWGLRYYNQQAFDFAKEATHLWISHFHSDHFHVPTLKKLLQINPGIIVYGNRSYNFQIDDSMRNLGFREVVSLYERTPVKVNDSVEITRYPTTGIDNMLVIRSKEGTILNYNDCNLPEPSRKMLHKKIGSIDIFMTNFNHAGKLLVFPFPGNEEIKKRLKNAFEKNYLFFEPKYIFPFASYHYYKSPFSFYQNDTMLSSDDLIELDEKIIPVNIGDSIVYSKGDNRISVQKDVCVVTPNEFKKVGYSAMTDFEELHKASLAYCRKLRKQYGIFTRLLPPFYIMISDYNIIARLDIKKGLVIEDNLDITPHIKTHSGPLYNWFSNDYGTDSFIVGAHFDILNENKIPLKWQIVFGLLIDNRLDLKSILKMAVTLNGLKFLLNRREEIWGILKSFQLHAQYHD